MAVSHAFERSIRPSLGGVPTYRTGALAGLAITTIASLVILHEVMVILGGSAQLLARVALAVALAWAVARYLSTRVAMVVFGALVVLGYFWYFFAVGGSVRLLVGAPGYVVAHTANDAITILTGRSVLTISATDVWALAFAPAPIFLTWYFGFRRRYLAAAVVAAGTMLLFVFSGDLGWWWTLLGTLGVVTAVGFGAFERRGASFQHAEWLIIVVAVMATTAVLVPLVPGGGLLGPLTFVGSDELGDGGAIEGTMTGTDSQLVLTGDISLSPEIRFVVEASEPAYWRTGVYDRYTGEGWVRSGEMETYTGPQEGPESGRLIIQTVTVEIMTERLPAAQRPSFITGVGELYVDDQGAFVAADALEEGETYRVYSIPAAEDDIVEGGEVPPEIQEHYTQLPEDTPQRVHDLTAELLADADGPVEKAEIVSAFLQQRKGYSHDVEVPDGDLADAFIFEMNAGYCSYFATAMVAMLRSADVPARMAVGYSHGQEVDENRWVVRGLNSHAWVEVYVPDAGWMTFDPTPASPRLGMRGGLVEEARADGHELVDTEESAGLPFEHDPAGLGQDRDIDVNESELDDPSPGEIGEDFIEVDEHDIDVFGPDLGEFAQLDADAPQEDEGFAFNWEYFGVVSIAAIGLAVAANRLEVAARLRRQLRLRWHLRRGDPREDCLRSLDRLEWAIAAAYRPRRPGETRRKHLRLFSMTNRDPRASRLYTLCEPVWYGGQVDRDVAEEAVALADGIVGDAVVFGGRLRP